MSLPAVPTVQPSVPAASDDARGAAWRARGNTLDRVERSLILAFGVSGGVR
jgi:hypothetical protein